MTQVAFGHDVVSAWPWRAFTRLRAAPRIVCAEIMGAVLGAVLLSVAAWTIEHRAVDMVLLEVTARAVDQARLAVLDQVEPTDLRPPFDQGKLARLDERLRPLQDLMRRPDSGIVRINLYARDGTLLFADRMARRGERVSQADAPMLAQALEGRDLVATRTNLEDAENEDLKPVLDEALEVYVPLVVEGEIVAAYEVYHDLGPVQAIRTLLLGLVLTLGLLCGACVALLHRSGAGGLSAPPPAAEQLPSTVPAQPGEVRAQPGDVPNAVGAQPREVRAQPGDAPNAVGAQPREVRAQPGGVPGAPALSRREREVLCQLASSHSYREIAQKLGVSEETIRTHVKSVLRKLGQPDRTQAVLAGVRLGLLRLS